MRRTTSRNGFVLAVGVACAWSGVAAAQQDISGHWRKTDFESLYSETGIGNYNAVPVNEAARLRADTWSPERLFMPEHQCEPHPAPYAPVGPANMRVEAVVDPRTQETIAVRMTLHWMENERTVWLDGRAHPPAWAPHTWGGFSTGEWNGDVLTVTTTHLKQGWIRRNGLPQSDRAVLREHWTVNGDILTLVSVLQDPVYLTEPLIRSIDWRRDPGYQIGSYTCHATRDVDHPYGYVPFYLPGQNTMLNDNLPAQWQLPAEAIRGEAHTLLPEYAETLESHISAAGRGEP